MRYSKKKKITIAIISVVCILFVGFVITKGIMDSMKISDNAEPTKSKSSIVASVSKLVKKTKKKDTTKKEEKTVQLTETDADGKKYGVVTIAAPTNEYKEFVGWCTDEALTNIVQVFDNFIKSFGRRNKLINGVLNLSPKSCSITPPLQLLAIREKSVFFSLFFFLVLYLFLSISINVSNLLFNNATIPIYNCQVLYFIKFFIRYFIK